MSERSKLLRAVEISVPVSTITYLATQLDLVYRIPFLNDELAQTFDDYAGDLAGPYSTYFIARMFMPRAFQISPIKTALLIYTVCTARELLQGTFGIPGKTDPIDMLFYTVGIGLALGFDHLTKKGRDRLRSV